MNTIVLGLFVLLSITGTYSQNHTITEEYLLNDCLKKFPNDLEKCAGDAFKHWNITTITGHPEQHQKAVCCTNWEVFACLTTIAETKCTATEKKSFEDFVKQDQLNMESELCKDYKRDANKCTQ